MRSDIAEALQPPPEGPGPQARSCNRYFKFKSTRGQKVCAKSLLKALDTYLDFYRRTPFGSGWT